MKRFLILLGFILLVTSCAHWKPVQGTLAFPQKNYLFVIPQGWYQYHKTDDFLLLTRDGVVLESISISRLPVTEKLEHTRKKLRRDMLPQEISEVILDDLRLNTNLLNFQLLENVPTKIDSFPGFKLTYQYEGNNGVLYKTILLGFIRKSLYYQLKYDAAARYYFDRYLPDFEKVVQTFRIMNK